MIRLFIVSILFLNISCKDKTQVCTESVLSDKQKLESEFKNLNSSSSNLALFKSHLDNYLNTHEDKKCLIGDVTFNPHIEIKEILKDINNSTVSIKIVHGDDNRVQALNHSNQDVQEVSKSILAQIPNQTINARGELDSKTLGESFNLCPGEKFENELSAAVCTGFLVDDDLVMTAGHCIRSESDCASFKWVFDYHSESNSIEPENIYSCDSIVARREDSLTGVDFAVIKLNKKVNNRKALKFRLTGIVPSETEIYILGHPSGLPMKYADDASVKNNISRVFFTSNLDTFGGNSGSPVFNKDTGVVEGILVRGDDDYVDSGSCRVVNTVAQDGDSEEVLRMSVTEGLDHYYLKSENETNEQLKAKDYVGVKGFPITMNVQKGFEYNLYGRKFLDACIYNISERYEMYNPIDQTSSECTDETFSSIYKKFNELITF
jgi:V8-like Glu-specific endopeptidase